MAVLFSRRGPHPKLVVTAVRAGSRQVEREKGWYLGRCTLGKVCIRTEKKSAFCNFTSCVF